MPLSDGRFPASDKDAITSAPTGEGDKVLASVNKYDTDTCKGALVEEVSAFRSDIEQFYDLHVLLWDADRGQTLDVRDDAAGSDVSYASPRVPEIELENEFLFADGTAATVDQRVFASVDSCALVVHNRASFEADGDRTLFTVLDLGIDEWDHGQDVDDATFVRRDGYAFVTACDGDRHLAVAQRRPETGQTTFDGCRVGIQGVREGDARSAWTDIYEENDGWITESPARGGKVDAGVGLYVGADPDVAWTTAIGFGRSMEGAMESARDVLERGYEAERDTFHEAWTAWHDSVHDEPTGDERTDALYDRSLTSMKAAQDPCGGTIAGAFKPHEMEYKHIWPRDQVIVIQALLAAGAHDDALEGLGWLADVQIPDGVVDERGIERGGSWWQNYYATGEPHWRHLQLDQVGGPIYAHWLAWRATGDDAVREEYYDTSRRAAEFLLNYDNDWGFPRKHQDPWEEIWGYSTEGVAAAIAGLRSAAELADAAGDDEFAAACRRRGDVWADNLETYCYKEGLLGWHYVTADDPEWPDTTPADRRPDAASFMAVWPWNVRAADHEAVQSTLAAADDLSWRADGTPCLGRYPGDDYTPTHGVEDGGWPICEGYADLVRWQSGADPDAVDDYLVHADDWTTAAGLLPERVDGTGAVRWNSNLQWSQAVYVLLAESLERGEPYGLAPGVEPVGDAG